MVKDLVDDEKLYEHLYVVEKDWKEKNLSEKELEKRIKESSSDRNQTNIIAKGPEIILFDSPERERREIKSNDERSEVILIQ